ncbi:Hypoxanthine phosphoribosyltransferase [Legionella lansingensis]|uniref:Hypoxanthine phosphoribosyltransferase n=1 Tax=Legionella lansingensis TaxID=45067 RepID=A0A0W0VXA3_9GAMM|nr:phosphoribosyltransferase family protein [Legionella lansingensis]KTD24326.1 Hypoxanthine phosphoribosyltransferase [Legionella lansingensis]SNV51789.1 Hypoxanthine phosphoribosyltransferase [Legionella lansingensis]
MRVLFTEEQIKERVNCLAEQINADYAGLTLDVICLVNSASMFCADLVRQFTVPSRLHFLSFNSYANGNASGEVRIIQDINEPLYARNVLVVEGIVVSGRTPRYILDMLRLRQPQSLAMCALGVKPAQLSVDLPLKYVAFELGSEIATGYGIGSGIEKVHPHLVSVQ